MEKRHTAQLNHDRESDYVYGLHAVEECILAGRTIDRILVQREQGVGLGPVLKLARQQGIPVQRVPTEKLNTITRKNHQGVVCFIAAVPFARLENVIADAYQAGVNPLVLVLDRVTDVRNFGAMARTAECAGATAIVMPEKNSVRLGSDAMKTSAGALNYLPVCRVPDLHQAVQYLKECGLHALALTEHSQHSIYQADLSQPLCLLLGNEDDGLAPNLLHLAHQQAALPMHGQVNSLNVSVAAAIALYEALRQRGL